MGTKDAYSRKRASHKQRRLIDSYGRMKLTFLQEWDSGSNISPLQMNRPVKPFDNAIYGTQ